MGERGLGGTWEMQVHCGDHENDPGNLHFVLENPNLPREVTTASSATMARDAIFILGMGWHFTSVLPPQGRDPCRTDVSSAETRFQHAAEFFLFFTR